MKEFVMGITGEGMSFHNKFNQLQVIEMSNKSKPWLRRVFETKGELKLKGTYPCRDIIK
jgi:hypothetical protein